MRGHFLQPLFCIFLFCCCSFQLQQGLRNGLTRMDVYSIHHFLTEVIARLRFRCPDHPDQRGYGGAAVWNFAHFLVNSKRLKKIVENGAKNPYFQSPVKAGGRLRSFWQSAIIDWNTAPAAIDCTDAVILDRLHNPPRNMVILSPTFQRRRRCSRRPSMIIALHIPLQGISIRLLSAGELGI